MSSAENVSASEMINSHIPNFFESTAYGDAPPDQTEVISAVALMSDIYHYPQTVSKIIRYTQRPSRKCQNSAHTSTAVRLPGPSWSSRAFTSTYVSAVMPPIT